MEPGHKKGERVTDEAPQEGIIEEAEVLVGEAKVQTMDSGWSLVEYGCWSISVGPDGLLMLPRHLVPEDVQDFVGACLAAAEVGVQVRKANAKRAEGDDRSLPRSLIRTAPSGTPSEGVRLQTVAGATEIAPVPRAAISNRSQPSQQGLRPSTVRSPARHRATE
jgi:hypothetical protein